VNRSLDNSGVCAAYVATPAKVKSRARLARILDADRYALIITNRRARRGIPVSGFSR
jgi:hypothetical protein